MESSALRPHAFSAVVASVVLLLLTSPAHAKREILVALDYQTDPALPACPGAADFRKEIARQLGHDPVREGAPRRLVVRLYATGARMGGRVEWRDASDQWEGERTFSSRSESCAEMARAMALATAIQIQLLASIDEGSLPKPAESKPANPAPGAVGQGPAGVAPTPVLVVGDGGPSPAPREPGIAVDVGVGVIQDFGDGPIFVVPRIAFSASRPAPSSLGLRLAASGLGPGADVTRSQGVAQIDRLLMTLELFRLFRPEQRVQPMLAAGVGLQDVRVQGISAMPDLAAAHAGHTFSAVVAASGGLTFVLTSRLAVEVEVEALFYRPALTITVGSSQAAYLDGAALFAHGGVLARF